MCMSVEGRSRIRTAYKAVVFVQNVPTGIYSIMPLKVGKAKSLRRKGYKKAISYSKELKGRAIGCSTLKVAEDWLQLHANGLWSKGNLFGIYKITLKGDVRYGDGGTGLSGKEITRMKLVKTYTCFDLWM